MTQKDDCEKLAWALNGNCGDPNYPPYTVVIYDSKTLRVSKTNTGLMFQHEAPEVLNNVGFDIYAIDPTDDKVSLLVRDRRKRS